MHTLMVLLLLGFIQPAFAITKCELNGKVTYKSGGCPEHASAKYLVKDKYVEERQLQKHKQKRIVESEKDFKHMNTPRKRPDESEEWYESEDQQIKLKKVQMSNESTHFQLQKVDKPNSKIHKINAPKVYDGVNDRLSEMERKLEQHNKELQQLQKQ